MSESFISGVASHERFLEYQERRRRIAIVPSVLAADRAADAEEQPAAEIATAPPAADGDSNG